MEARFESRTLPFSVESARGRQTADNSFGAALGRGAAVALEAVGSGAKKVVEFFPGGSYVTAVCDAVAGGVAAGGGLGGGDKWDLLRAQRQLQDEGLANSLHLLALQRKMNEENQAFTTASNVMKARHEMAKTAIGNLR